MTEDERKAMDWLDREIAAPPMMDIHDKAHLRTLKDMLARPVLPEEPTQGMLRVMRLECEAEHAPSHVAAQCYRALYAHLTAPKTSWRVEWTNGECLRGVLEFGTHDAALAEVKTLSNKGYTAYIWRQPRVELP